MAAAESSRKNDEKKQDDGDEEDGENSKTTEKLRKAAEKARPTPLFSIAIDDIVGIKKLGGLGWKGKLIGE